MRSFFSFLATAAVIGAISLISCKKDPIKGDCDVSNPVEEIDWLKTAIAKVKQDRYSYYAMAI